MRYRLAGVVATLCMLVVVTWSVYQGQPEGVGPPREGESASSAWPSASDVLTGGSARIGAPWAPLPVATELTATGIEIVNSPGVQSMAVDGSGAVWLLSPWQLTRVDPGTAAARTWDVADDAAFATVRSIEPSKAAGVWLVESDRVRLFDGQRFVRDLPVPADHRGGEGVRISDVLEVGSELWVSSAAGVARSAGGPWTMVGDDTIDGASALTAGADGAVWTIGQLLRSDGELIQTVMRFDGNRWMAVDGLGSPPLAEELVAHPDGGVIVRFGNDVRRFDGMSWRAMPPLTTSLHLGGFFPDSLGMSVARDGALWVVGPEGLARADDSGQWQTVAEVEEPSLVGVGVAGNEVLVADSLGLLRLDRDQLDRVWTATRRGFGAAADRLLVVSSDEVWATGGGAIRQFLEGQWRMRAQEPGWLGGSHTGWGSASGLALAADGAVWAITAGALARFVGEEPTLVPRDRADGWLLAGPEKGVWAVEVIWPGWSRWYAGEDPDGTSVSLVRDDGTQFSVPLPGPPWSVTSLAADAKGTIWVTICEEDVADYCTVPSLMRWDGQWSVVPHPGADVTAAAVTANGGLWALLTTGSSADESPFVALYDRGTWTRFPEVTNLRWLSPAPGGGTCGVDMDASDLVCVDASAEVSRTALAVPGRVHIGPDGSLWVQDGGVVARLPGTVPG